MPEKAKIHEEIVTSLTTTRKPGIPCLEIPTEKKMHLVPIDN